MMTETRHNSRALIQAITIIFNQWSFENCLQCKYLITRSECHISICDFIAVEPLEHWKIDWNINNQRMMTMNELDRLRNSHCLTFDSLVRSSHQLWHSALKTLGVWTQRRDWIVRHNGHYFYTIWKLEIALSMSDLTVHCPSRSWDEWNVYRNTRTFTIMHCRVWIKLGWLRPVRSCFCHSRNRCTLSVLVHSISTRLVCL